MTTRYRRIGLMVGIALIAVGIAGWLVSSRTPRPAYQKDLPDLSADSIAKIPSGFPRFLILGDNPVVTSGLVTHDTSTEKTYHLTYWSAGTPQTLTDEFKDLFSHTGWTITSESKRGSQITLSARRMGFFATGVFTIRDQHSVDATMTYMVRTSTAN